MGQSTWSKGAILIISQITRKTPKQNITEEIRRKLKKREKKH